MVARSGAVPKLVALIERPAKQRQNDLVLTAAGRASVAQKAAWALGAVADEPDGLHAIGKAGALRPLVALVTELAREPREAEEEDEWTLARMLQARDWSGERARAGGTDSTQRSVARIIALLLAKERDADEAQRRPSAPLLPCFPASLRLCFSPPPWGAFPPSLLPSATSSPSPPGVRRR